VSSIVCAVCSIDYRQPGLLSTPQKLAQS
jgi:hypothetical protein